MEYAQDWGRSRERFLAFWERELVDRCCIAVKAPRAGAPPYVPEPLPRTAEEIRRHWLDPELNLRRMLGHMERTYYGGEAYPATTMCLGASVMAEFFGAPAEFRLDTVWFHPALEHPADFPWDADPRASELWAATAGAARHYARECRGRCFVGLPELGSATDDLSLLRGMQSLVYDMLDCPATVSRAIRVMADAWCDLHGELCEIARPCNDGGCCIPWMQTWAPGPNYQMSCDFSAVLSPPMFREFIVPEIERYLEANTYSVYHWDGPDAVKHLDAILEIEGIRAIQWTPGAGQPRTSDPRWLPYYRRIREAGKCLILPCLDIDEVEPILSQLSSRGLLLVTYARSEDEARSLVRRVGSLTRE